MAERYDAFISYSHAADGLLAPRLQAGLQRFAKPWWKRRAIRVFRDESSLSANPHLWSSITDALDASEWFVLLLSPDAAASPWVNDEVTYWLQHKDKDRILPVVTDGEFGPDILPPALTFDDEPRWVDLRLARTEEQLDLKNPTFSAAIADIASAVRGVPKDELESEEVRQHRRTIRTAWSAGFVVATLAVLAAVFGINAANERDERARDARLALARELSASSSKVEDPELAVLLAIEAIEATAEDGFADRSAQEALHGSLTGFSMIAQYEFAGPVALDALESRFLVGSDRIAAIEASTGTIVSEEPIPAGVEVTALEVSADGSTMAYGLFTAGDGEPYSVEIRRGSRISTIASAGYVSALALDDTGSVVAVASGFPFGREHSVEEVTRLFDTTTGAEVASIPQPGGSVTVAFGPAGAVLTADLDGVGAQFSDATGEAIGDLVGNDFSVAASAFLGAGDRFVTGSYDGTVDVFTVSPLERDFEFAADQSFLLSLSASADGLTLATGSLGGEFAIWDLSGGGAELVSRTDAGIGGLLFVALSADAQRLLTVAETGVSRLWDLSPDGQSEVFAATADPKWVGDLEFDSTGQRLAFSSGDGTVTVADMESGRVLRTIHGAGALQDVGTYTGVFALSWGPDDEILATASGDGNGGIGKAATFAVSDGQQLAEFGEAAYGTDVTHGSDGSIVWSAGGPVTIDGPNGTISITPAIAGGEPDAAFVLSADLSAVGRYVALLVTGGTLEVWDVTAEPTLQWTRSVELAGLDDNVDFAPDGRTFATSGRETIVIWDATTGDVVLELVGHDSPIEKVSYSDDGSLLASASMDDTVRVWRVDDGTEILALPVPGAADVDIDPTDNFIATYENTGLVKVWILDSDRLVELARSRVTRSLTEQECQIYLHRPCEEP